LITKRTMEFDPLICLAIMNRNLNFH